MRIVLDSQSQLPVTSRLVQSTSEAPVMIVTGKSAPAYRIGQLESVGVEVLRLPAESRQTQLEQLLDELGRRAMTNVLVEGGGQLLGALWDARLVDEVHAFVAPILLGGQSAPTPLSGSGVGSIGSAIRLVGLTVETLGDDVHLHGRTAAD